MSRIVVDASMLGPLIVPDEADQLVPAVVDALFGGGAVVPQHWRLEVSNLARMAVRRKRLDEATLSAVFERLLEIIVAVDPETERTAWTSGIEFSRRYDLTAYDAAYLELAVRLRLPLATGDARLKRAAVAEGVPLVAP